MIERYFKSFLLAVIISNFLVVFEYPEEVWTILMLSRIIIIFFIMTIMFAIEKFIKKIIERRE